VASKRREQQIPVFVAERYLPGASHAEVVAASSRLWSAAEHLAGAGFPVRLLSTTFVPSEEWVFDVFAAETTADVARAYADAGVNVERIAGAIHMPAG
jgi:hypothetical protein